MPARIGLLKRSISAVAVISTLVPMTACGGGSTASGDVHAICQILQTDTVATAAEDLLEKISDDAWEGGLATDLVISAVQDSCDSLLARAVTVVQRFFGTHPQQTRVATVAHFQSLSSSADGSIATQLDNLGFKVSGHSVGVLVDELCRDLHGSRDSSPVQDIQSLLPDADLRLLPALNGVVAQVTRTCTPLNSFQADGLVSSIYQYLVSNEQLAATPLVITRLTWSWVSAGTINVNWAASYTGIEYDLWVSNDGQWEQLENGTSQTSTQVSNLFAGHLYEFAVRAVADGSVSPWSYMYPCLTCAA
jgi:Fibronectin type III domain